MTGLIVGVIVCVIGVAAAAVVAWYCKKQRHLSQQPDPPPTSKNEMIALRQKM